MSASDVLVRFSMVQKTYDGGAPRWWSNPRPRHRRGEFLTLLGPSGSGKTTT
jgi:putative spermidine/putrescine transport system ATP-binding protein